MPKPFANSAQITYSLVNGDWLLGIQTGNSTGDAGLPQMKHIKLSQLSDWVRGTYGQIWRYRGPFSASLPSDPQVNDYFLATATFTVDGVTYTKDHLYAYNASGTWDDISDILTQYASQSQVTDIDDRLTVVEVKVDAMGDGIVYKGEVATYADLAGIVDPQTGWEYYVTADAAFYVYNGASWDQIDNGIVQTITDGDTAHAPSGDAVYDALAAEAAARTAADSNLKDALTAIDHRLENIEQSKGDYIVSSYKDGSTTPSGKGKWCVVEGVEGVSRVENNAIKNGDFSDGGNDWTTLYSTLNVVNGVAEITKLTANPSLIQPSTDVPLLAGHSYLGVADLKGEYSVVSLYDPSIFSSVAYSLQTPTDSSFMNCSFVYTVPSGGVSAKFGLRNFTGGGANKTFYAKNAGFIDLNIYFNTTDLSFLGATDSAKLATIQKDYPHLLQPSDYGTRIVDWTGNGVRAWARNLWDEQWETGAIDSNGANTPNLNRMRSAGFIEIPITTLYFYAGGGTRVELFYYNENKVFCGYDDIARDSTFTPPFGAKYMRFSTYTAYGATYQHNICINKSDSQNGTYTPYHAPDTLSFPSTTLKSAGSVRDTLELNVEVDGVAKRRDTQRLGSVDLGSLSWTCDGTFLETYVTGKKIGVNALLCPRYITSYVQYATQMVDGEIRGHAASTRVTVKDSSKIDPNKTNAENASAFKTAMDGVVLYYELATPVVTLSDPILDNTLLTEAYGRLSTVQTGTVVDGIADLGFITL